MRLAWEARPGSGSCASILVRPDSGAGQAAFITRIRSPIVRRRLRARQAAKPLPNYALQQTGANVESLGCAPSVRY
jgi:hypothetical protein